MKNIKIKIKILTVILFIIIALNNNSYGQTSKPKEDEYRSYRVNEHKDCSIMIDAESDYINIGSIFAGTTVATLPSEDGTSNEMIFQIHGKNKSEILISAYFSSQAILENGYLKINSWTWEIHDRATGDSYGKKANSVDLTSQKIVLIERGDKEECKSYATIKLTLNSVTATPNATPGQNTLNVFFQASAIEY